MSQSQPLSSLAPEFNSQLQTVPSPLTMLPQVPVNQPVQPTQPVVPQVPMSQPNNLPVVDIDSIHKPCPPKNPCANKKADHEKTAYAEKNHCGYGMGYGWGWLGALILWFLIFIVLFWLVFYSLKPSFVLQSDSSQVDTAKVLLASIIAALILIVVIWLIKFAITKRP